MKPTNEQIIILHKQIKNWLQTYKGVGTICGVSDNAVRKRFKTLKLEKITKQIEGKFFVICSQCWIEFEKEYNQIYKNKNRTDGKLIEKDRHFCSMKCLNVFKKTNEQYKQEMREKAKNFLNN